MSIKFENVVLPSAEQWRAIILGVRNPFNSWEKSDSHYCNEYYGCEKTRECDSLPNCYEIGPNDLDLMRRLAAGGPVHAKYRRMITVIVTITAPLYWWKEFDTYKVSTVANSCSTMHKIADKEFTLEDFSCEHFDKYYMKNFKSVIDLLNKFRREFNDPKINKYQKRTAWYSMTQLLPSSYNQKRTVMLNYEVLAHIWNDRRRHKLDEWREHTADEKVIGYFGFCDWIKTLPYSELITQEEALASE